MFPNKVLQKVSKAEILQNARVGTAVHCLPGMFEHNGNDAKWVPPCPACQVWNRRVYIHLLCLLFRKSHNSKCHFLKWKSAATAALSAQEQNGRTLSMAAKPFILTVDSVCPFCYLCEIWLKRNEPNEWKGGLTKWVRKSKWAIFTTATMWLSWPMRN